MIEVEQTLSIELIEVVQMRKSMPCMRLLGDDHDAKEKCYNMYCYNH